MIKAIRTFHRGFTQYHPAIKIWLTILMAGNVVIPLGLLPDQVAMAVLITMLLNMILMTMLTAQYGFSRILGLGHFFWLPLSVYLFSCWPDYPIESPLGIWLRLVTLTNIASLVVDTIDVVRFAKGERETTA